MGIQERREREREQRRNDILKAAEQVFFSKGVQLATMDDVAAAAELSKGTLYLYFNSKQELYLGIHERGFELLRQMFFRAAAEKHNGLEKIRAIGYAYFEFANTYPDYYNAIMYFENTGLDFSSDKELMDTFHISGFRILNFVQDIIRAGQADGSITLKLDVDKTAFLLWGQLSGIIQVITKIGKHPEKNIDFAPMELLEIFMQVMGEILSNRQIKD